MASELDRPTLVLRARVFARRWSLDQDLAHGVSPLRAPALALRARQLVSRTNRDRLATSLERLVEDAERGPSLAAVLCVPRTEIQHARGALLELAACLRAERPVYAEGMALLSRLVSDGVGPAYNPHAGCSLSDAVRVAADALDGHWRTAA